MTESQIQAFLTLLRSYDSADEQQVNRLAELLYPDLRRIAAGLLRDERRIGISMQATVLAGDSIMRLIVKQRVEPNDYPHFLNIAAAAMRRMLVDHIRRKRAQKRPSSLNQSELPDDISIPPEMAEEVIAVNEAIDKLGPDYRDILVMHYFGGASVDDLSKRFGLAERTIKRRLDAARLRMQALLKPKAVRP